jgi:hypothetical protein
MGNEIMKGRTIQGYKFEYSLDNSMFECRGELTYDEEHDEIPDPKLWEAALMLEKMLKHENRDVQVNHSEKGWVEVQVFY